MFLLRPPNLLRRGPFLVRKNVCNSQEIGVRTRRTAIVNHPAVLKILRVVISGLQKGAAERGQVKKTSKIVKKCQKVFRQFSRRAKNVKNRPKSVKKFFDTSRAAPFFRPLLQSAEVNLLRVVFLVRRGPLGFPRKWRKRRQEPELPDWAWNSQTSFFQTSAATRQGTLPY